MSARQRHDLVILSDLHLGEGVLQGEMRYSPTEDFFLDKPFVRFLGHLQEQYRDDPDGLVLVLNGDIFDFLTVTRVPDDQEAAKRGIEVSPSERKFGLEPSEKKSIYKLDTIFHGHREWFQALSRFVAAGFRVEVLPGNHDLEIYFPGVRRRLQELLASFEDGARLEQAEELVTFHRWFYLEPGRIYIEHGHQYDSSNSTRYPLRPLISNKPTLFRKEPKEELLDYPLGSIFVRYFYNRVRRIDPYTPRLLTFDQYIDFVKRYNLFDVWRVYRDHYPHFVAALGPDTPLGLGGESKEADALQGEEFTRLEGIEEHGRLYRGLSELKIHPASARTAAVVREMIEPVFKRMFWLGIFAFVAVILWFFIFQLIQKIPWIVANVFLLAVFAVTSIAALAWSWIHFRRRQQRQATSYKEQTTVEQAGRIAACTGAPIVALGHTHVVDIHVLGSGAKYINSGTWTSVHNPWNRIMRDARRKTFIYVRGDDAELVRWNDDACRIDEVPLFYLENAGTSNFGEAELVRPQDIGPEHPWLPSAEAVSSSEPDDVTD